MNTSLASPREREYPMANAPKDGSFLYARVDLDGEEAWIPLVRWDSATDRWWEHFQRPVEHDLLGWHPMHPGRKRQT